MTDIVFARTRYNYDSYVDFWRLAELSRFEICWVDEIDILRPCIYITSPLNGEIIPHLRHRRSLVPNGSQVCRIIRFNLERPDSGDNEKVPLDVSVRKEENASHVKECFDAEWVADRKYASHGDALIHAVLGSHLGLSEGWPMDKAFDVTHMSYVWGRRAGAMANIQAAGVSIGPNAWGAARAAVLRQSRAMLNIHQTPASIGEPLRFALAAAYGLPLLTESIEDPWPLDPSRDFFQAPLESLPASVKGWLSNPDELARRAQNMKRLLCEEWTFRRGVEDAIEMTSLRWAAEAAARSAGAKR